MSDAMYKIKLRKGDTVVVRSGKYRGKTGKVTAVHPTTNKVTVEGINVVKKHVKPNKEHPQGAIVEKTMPLWVSKVAAIDATTKKQSKIGFKTDKTGKKVRILKKTGKEMK